jgi:hypothetical protein
MKKGREARRRPREKASDAIQSTEGMMITRIILTQSLLNSPGLFLQIHKCIYSVGF